MPRLTPLSDLLHDIQNIIVVHGIAGLVEDADDGIFCTRAGGGVSGGELARGGWAGAGGSYCECYSAH